MTVRWFALMLAGLTGCSFTQYFKEVVVTQDGDGKVKSIVITERVIQPREVGAPFNPEYIKVQNYRLPIPAQPANPTITLVPMNEEQKPEPGRPSDATPRR